MSFPYLFIRSLVEVHRSSSSAHALFFPIFIHQILLHLGLEEFLVSEPVHIIAPIGTTVLRQRAASMRASFKCSKVESFSGVAPLPSPSSGDPTADAYVDPTATADPPPSTSDDSSIHCMLDIAMTVQAGDMLTEL